MNKAVKKLRKLKADLDKLEEKEEVVLEKIDEAIEELENCDHSNCGPVQTGD